MHLFELYTTHLYTICVC